MRRVVITGLGAVAPVGNDVDTIWENVVAGRSGITRVTLFDPGEVSCQIAGEVKDFDPVKHLGRKDARRSDRFAQFAMVAAQQALADSALEINEDNAARIGVAVGSGIGGINTIVEQVEVMRKRGAMRVSPFFVSMMLADTAPGRIAMQHGLRGPNLSFASACATGTNSIGEAAEWVRSGRVDAIVTGSSEAPIFELSLGGFGVMGTLTQQNDEPEKASRPFDKNRDGFVPGEGAGVLILEEYEHAMARGARMYAEVLGYGSTADAYHLTAPQENGAGAAAAMQMALDQAGLQPTDIDYLNAHGTSTVLNDKSETTAIKSVYGEAAYDVPISSTKSMMGHLLGAAGSVEAVICVKVLQEQVIPPTINYETPDPECDLDYVPNVARPAKVQRVMSNSFGFGGHNACLIFASINGSERANNA